MGTLYLTTGALAGPAFAAQSTAAATAQSDGQEIVYQAAPGQANQVKVYAAKDGDSVVYTIGDTVEITAGTSCAYPDDADHTKVTCTVLHAPRPTTPLPARTRTPP
jgi:hypothetical protein